MAELTAFLGVRRSEAGEVILRGDLGATRLGEVTLGGRLGEPRPLGEGGGENDFGVISVTSRFRIDGRAGGHRLKESSMSSSAER